MRTAGKFLLVPFEGLGALVIEKTVFPYLFDPPWLYVLFGIVLITIMVLFFRDIVDFLDADTRATKAMMRRAKEREEREAITRRQSHVHWIRTNPFLGKPELHSGTIKAPFMPHKVLRRRRRIKRLKEAALWLMRG